MGRITLAKSTLSTLANYSMQTAKIPRSICDDLDKKTRRFIWGGNEDKRAIHSLSWEVLQKPVNQGGIGISSARKANAAFLTKLGWRVLVEPNSLWSRVLRHKYCQGRCDVDMFVPKHGMSNVWAGITDNAKVLGEGMRVAVGNGLQTLFWDHKWAMNKPLSDVVTQPLPTVLAGATVNELWEPNLGWKWDVLAPYLSQEHLKIIQAHELKEDPELGDLVYWQGDNKGKFSIKAAISIMKQETQVLDEDCWELIWKAPIQQRQRAFLWMACHDRLMDNLNRFKRKITDDPKCYICGHDTENAIHILRECPAATMVWQSLGGPANKEEFFLGNIKQWITHNLRVDDHGQAETWSTLFGITVWWLWRWRNSRVFNNSAEIPIDLGAFLQIRFDEIKRALLSKEDAGFNQNKMKEEIFVQWNAPPEGWYALNSDGASKGTPGPAGGGAIIRDHVGTFVTAISANFGICSAFKAEVLALHKGLQLARNLQITKLMIQLDNLACVQILRSKEAVSGECAHLFKCCKELLDDPDWIVHVTHVYREGNRAADWLANNGVVQSCSLHLFQNPPPLLGRILDEDSQGVAFPRLVPP